MIWHGESYTWKVEIRRFGGQDVKPKKSKQSFDLKLGGYHTVYKKRGRPRKEDTLKNSNTTFVHKDRNDFRNVYDSTKQNSKINSIIPKRKRGRPPKQTVIDNKSNTTLFKKEESNSTQSSEKKTGKSRNVALSHANILSIGKAIATNLSSMETHPLQPNTEVRDVLNNMVSSIANPATMNVNTYRTAGSSKRGRPRKNGINKTGGKFLANQKPMVPIAKATYSNNGNTLHNTMNFSQLSNRISVSQNAYHSIPYLPVQNVANNMIVTNNYVPHLKNTIGEHSINNGRNIQGFEKLPFNSPFNIANKSKVQPKKKRGRPRKNPAVSCDKSFDTKKFCFL